MAHKWSEIREKMSPERRERNREKTAALLLAMDLAGLRDNMDLTQEEVAARLQISQSNVSRLEKRRDMLVSTLREVVEAFGGVGLSRRPRWFRRRPSLSCLGSNRFGGSSVPWPVVAALGGVEDPGGRSKAVRP